MNDTTAAAGSKQSERATDGGPQAGLREAKVQMKAAARATLLAARSALDYALTKLGDDTTTGVEREDGDRTTSAQQNSEVSSNAGDGSATDGRALS